MSKVITFSRVFPSYHPKAGQPTFFVEKIWESIYLNYPEWLQDKWELRENFNLCQSGIYTPKHHTIRAGHNWKDGDWFNPVVWGDDINPKSGRKGPYHSKQIKIAPPIQINKTWDFYIKELPSKNLYALQFFINGELIEEGVQEFVCKLAKNDGFTVEGDLIDCPSKNLSFLKSGLKINHR